MYNQKSFNNQFFAQQEPQMSTVIDKQILNETTQGGFNKFLFSMLCPFEAKDIRIPDFNSGPLIPKTVTYLKTLTSPADNWSGIILYQPYNRRHQFKVYLQDPVTQGYFFSEYIDPQELLGDNFAKIRPVVGGFNFFSDTISSTNFTLGGTASAVQVLDLPPIINISQQTISAYKRDSTAAALNVKLSDGLVVNAEPTDESSLQPYQTNSVMNVDTILSTSWGFTNLTATSVYPVLATMLTINNIPPNLNGRFRLEIQVSEVVVGAPAYIHFKFGVHGRRWNTGILTPVATYSEFREYVTNPFYYSVNNFKEFDVDYDVESITLEMGTIGGSVAVTLPVVNVNLLSYTYYSSGTNNPCSIMLWEGVNKSQVLKFSAVSHYECQPDFTLSKNLQTTFEKVIEDANHIKIVQLVFGNKELFGIKTIYPLSEYKQKILQGDFIQLAGSKMSQYFAADDFWNTVKTMGKGAVPYISALLSTYNPMLGPITTSIGNSLFAGKPGDLFAGSFSTNEEYYHTYPSNDLEAISKKKLKFLDLKKEIEKMKMNKSLLEKEIESFQTNQSVEFLEGVFDLVNQNQKEEKKIEIKEKEKEKENPKERKKGDFYATTEEIETTLPVEQESPYSLPSNEVFVYDGDFGIFPESPEYYLPVDDYELGEDDTDGKNFFAADVETFEELPFGEPGESFVVEEYEEQSTQEKPQPMTVFHQTTPQLQSENERLRRELQRMKGAEVQHPNPEEKIIYKEAPPPKAVQIPQQPIQQPVQTQQPVQQLQQPLDPFLKIATTESMNVSIPQPELSGLPSHVFYPEGTMVEKPKTGILIKRSVILAATISKQLKASEEIKNVQFVSASKMPGQLIKGAGSITEAARTGGPRLGRATGVFLTSTESGLLTEVFFGQGYFFSYKPYAIVAYLVKTRVQKPSDSLPIDREYRVMLHQCFPEHYIKYFATLLALSGRPEKYTYCLSISAPPLANNLNPYPMIVGKSLYLSIYAAVNNFPYSGKYAVTGEIMYNHLIQPVIVQVKGIPVKREIAKRSGKILVGPPVAGDETVSTGTVMVSEFIQSSRLDIDYIEVMTPVELFSVFTRELIAPVLKKQYTMVQQSQAQKFNPKAIIITYQLQGGITKAKKFNSDELAALSEVLAEDPRYKNYIDALLVATGQKWLRVASGMAKQYLSQGGNPNKFEIKEIPKKLSQEVTVTNPSKTAQRFLNTAKGDYKEALRLIKSQFGGKKVFNELAKALEELTTEVVQVGEKKELKQKVYKPKEVQKSKKLLDFESLYDIK